MEPPPPLFLKVIKLWCYKTSRSSWPNAWPKGRWGFHNLFRPLGAKMLLKRARLAEQNWIRFEEEEKDPSVRPSWQSYLPFKMLRPEATAAIIPLLMMVLLAGPGLCVERIEPPPCKEGRECLPYTVACHGDGYEAQRYPASAWVGTSINSSVYSAAVFRGFWRLFRYIQGRNEKGVKIPMTAPVVTQVMEGPGVQTISVYFMVPEAFREDTPVPTEETVYLEQFPPLEAYVRFFGGWMTDASHLAELSNLDTRLQRDGRTTKVGVHYTAGFNSPMELKNRRNEVWRIAEGELACRSALGE